MNQKTRVSLLKAATALSAIDDRDVNYIIKKMRMELREQSNYYWDLSKKAKDPEEKAACEKAAKFLSDAEDKLEVRFSS